MSAAKCFATWPNAGIEEKLKCPRSKMPVTIPQAWMCPHQGKIRSVKGSGGKLSLAQNALVKVNNDGKLSFEPANDPREANAMSGTIRQLVNNMVVGVSKGFEKKLTLIGVGFQGQLQPGSKLNLAVGYSHPVNKEMPAGITVATPTPTEIVIKGRPPTRRSDRCRDPCRSSPEPYKGKGIRYSDEKVTIKETKKK